MQIAFHMFLKTVFACVILFSSHMLAFAQSPLPQSVGDNAIILAKKIETLTYIAHKKSEDEDTQLSFTNYRSQILGAFDRSNDLNINDLISSYRNFSFEMQSQTDIKLAKYYTRLAEVYINDSFQSPEQVNSALLILDEILNDSNWIIAHQAQSLAAVIHSYSSNFAVALQHSIESLSIIPEDISENTEYARSYSYSIIAYLHCVLKNPEMAISAIQTALNHDNLIGERVDGANVINNLIYAFDGWRDYETVEALTEILLRIESKIPSDTAGLTELRAASAYINLGRYDFALNLLDKGLLKVESVIISRNLSIIKIQALAGLEQISAAKKEFKKLQSQLADKDYESFFVRRELQRAEALIAAAQGDAATAIRKMESYNDLSVQNILKSNNSDTASLLANLENDKARQIEREQAQKREADLREESLRNAARTSKALMLVSLLFALAAGAVAIFMRFRTKVALELTEAAEAALAGEKAKTQFLAVISHELRTPLNGIIGIADLLSQTAPTEILRKQIGIINSSGHDLLKLVEQVLDMSRIDAQEMDVFPEFTKLEDIIKGLDTLWRTSIEKKSVIFTTYVDPSVPDCIMVDPLRLRQCINNLLSNSAKFTKQGRIHLHVTAQQGDTEDMTSIQIIVADTGIGMSPSVQNNLFKPFVQADGSITRQYGGSGLGLAITRSLAHMMDGDLTVKSKENAGTEFTFTLRAAVKQTHVPLVKTPPSKLPETKNTTSENEGSKNNIFEDILDSTLSDVRPAADPYDDLQDIIISPSAIDNSNQTLKKSCHQRFEDTVTTESDLDKLDGLKVLVVEDVPSNQDVLKIFLEPENCTIITTSNGQEALHAVSQQRFDVVLMDIRMPEMDGIAAVRIIRARAGENANVPIIALTADATAETNAQCMAAGADIFLTKPIIATELLDAIRFVRRQAYSRAERAKKSA